MYALLDPFGFGQPGLERHARRFAPLPDDLRGLRVAVTGANSGIGLAATAALAARGAEVWMLCRDRARGESARASLAAGGQDAHGGALRGGAPPPPERQGPLHVERLDVADPDSIRALRIPTPDVLVHNAGMLATAREDVPWRGGYLERTVATHLAGPWMLDRLLRAPTSIWVSSGGMYTQRLDVARTFAPPEPFDGVVAYARCKRAQVVVARHLGQHAMHPGWADSPGVASSLPRFHRLTRDILRTPAGGADTIVWLAATRPAAPGFWFDRAPAPEFPIPGTRPPEGEEEALLARLEAVTGVGR